MLALWKILVKYKMLLIGGVKITVIISVLTILFGLIFGTLMAFMKMSKVRLLRWFANAYVEFIRGTPVLVQISIVLCSAVWISPVWSQVLWLLRSIPLRISVRSSEAVSYL